MNKAITDGVLLMPPAFGLGLGVWSSGDGTPGSDTYDGAAGAALVPADQDFGGCLELVKTQSVQKLRYMGETPLLPGCYLRVTARVKAVSGALPSVRIAGWAGGSGGTAVPGLPTAGPSVTLTSYGEVVEVSAIIGAGNRNGVDMVWGTDPLYGHFGLDLTGPDGGVIRIDDIIIEDYTRVFLRDMLSLVDVRDFGAKGDGSTDDHAAFERADAAANGRKVLVSEGTYFLGDSVTFENRVEFAGRVTMPTDKILSLTQNFDLPSYVDAFGDEVTAFKKAFQALLNNAGHDSLDLCGRRIELTEPIDMQAAVPNRTSYATRRVIRNGQFQANDSAAWDTETVTSQATYSTSNPYTLTSVANVANIPVGALVEGAGVGREVYVRERNVSAGTLTLSMPLFDAAGTQVFTFKRFKYLLDFSGFGSLAKFCLSDIEFQCSGRSSGILLAPAGLIFHVKDCFITRPKDRGITSPGEGCQGMLIDRCQFLSDESALRVQDRVSIALNATGNDVKLRNNRCRHFKHFAVLAGSGNVLTGNHWFHGDGEAAGVRMAGVVLTQLNCKSTLTGNYIDNNFVEWSNEHDPAPGFSSEFSFGGLTINGNVFTVNDVAPWFSFIVLKPHGAGHFVNGLSVTGNVFRTLNGNIQRVDRIDTTFAGLDYGRMRNVVVEGNTFNGVDEQIRNPLVLKHAENTAARTWTVDCAPHLPFGGWARTVQSVLPEGAILDASGSELYSIPYATTKQGANSDQINLVWERSCRGEVTVTVRMDNPL